MPAKQKIATKKYLMEIRKAFDEEIVFLVKDLRETHELNKKLLEENKKLVEKLEKLTLKMEKISIKAELIHETFLDVMVLVKLDNKKIRDLEKRLNLEVNH